MVLLFADNGGRIFALDDTAGFGRDKKFKTNADFRRDEEIFNRLGGDGDNFLPTLRDEIYNLHFARHDSRNDFLCKIFRGALESFYRLGGRLADNLSADFIFDSLAAH